MLVILALCLLQLLHVDACETSKDGVTWVFDASVDEKISGVETVEQCKNECLKNETCTAYTLQEGPSISCFLFLQFLDPSQLISCPSCKSGFITRIYSGKGAILNAAEDVIDVAETFSAEECLDLCADTPKCTVFFYLNSSLFQNFCFLGSAYDGAIDCEDCQVGELRCFLPDECYDYKVLDDSTRNNQHGREQYCDDSDHPHTSPDWQGPGWYRMSASTAGTMIAQKNPGQHHCGTEAPGWTRDEHPQTPGDQKNMTVCFSSGSDECDDQTQISATNCEGYFVYKLDTAPSCSSRYCGTF